MKTMVIPTALLNVCRRLIATVSVDNRMIDIYETIFGQLYLVDGAEAVECSKTELIRLLSQVTIVELRGKELNFA